jgi:hypothetical protein
LVVSLQDALGIRLAGFVWNGIVDADELHELIKQTRGRFFSGFVQLLEDEGKSHQGDLLPTDLQDLDGDAGPAGAGGSDRLGNLSFRFSLSDK